MFILKIDKNYLFEITWMKMMNLVLVHFYINVSTTVWIFNKCYLDAFVRFVFIRILQVIGTRDIVRMIKIINLLIN